VTPQSFASRFPAFSLQRRHRPAGGGGFLSGIFIVRWRLSRSLIGLGVGGLSPGSALLFVFDRLWAADRRSAMRCLSFSDLVSIPFRRSFVVTSPDRFSSLPIVVSVGCRESCWMVRSIASCGRTTAARKGSANQALGADGFRGFLKGKFAITLTVELWPRPF
jgi:hypothetical protein